MNTRRNALRLVCLSLLCAACGTTGGGGGGATIAPGTPCDSVTQHELCSGVVRLSCVGGVWQMLEACGYGHMCVVLPASIPGYTVTGCVGAPGFDAASSELGMPDIASFDIDLQPDIATPIDLPKTGCSGKAECDDGLPCTADNCLNNVCQHLTQDALCGGGPCVTGKCNVFSGCTQTPKSGSCDDGDDCTAGDLCKSGACVGQPLSCDDGNPCTSDSCQGGGCQYKTIPNCSDNTMEAATSLTPGKPVSDFLSPTGDVDYYKFAGQKGQLVLVQLQSAQTSQKKPMDPTIIDTVLTMYGPDQEAYAFDDDPYGVLINDSEIWTILPQTGTYWLRVEECWTYLASQPGTGSVCAPPQNKSTLEYAIGVSFLDPGMSATFAKDAETGDNWTNATTVGFEKAPDGKNYYLDILYGTFKNGVDTDPFSLTPPLDVPVAQGRPTLFVRGLPGGLQGNGSTCDPGVISALGQNGTGLVAQADLAQGLLEVPAKLGQKLVLLLKHGTGPMGSNDFYVLKADVGDSGPLEQDEAGNDAASGAEVLTANKNGNNNTAYFIAGDLVGQGADVDHFSFAIPSGSWLASVFCASAGIGSGVQGMQAALLSKAGVPLPGAAGAEADGPQQVKDFAVPAGTAGLVLKVSASGQSASVSGSFYRCTVELKAK